MPLPEKGKAYSMPITLESKNTSEWLIDPPIQTGDFQVSVDFGGFANLAILPVVEPAGSRQVKLSLAAAEMLGDKVLVIGSDVGAVEGEGWRDLGIFFDLIEGTVETLIDLAEGDHTETSIRSLIKKKNTDTTLLDKKVAGSGLQPNITVTTREQS